MSIDPIEYLSAEMDAVYRDNDGLDLRRHLLKRPLGDLSKRRAADFRGFSSRGIELKPATLSVRDGSAGTGKGA
jgi:hypothetical protein